MGGGREVSNGPCPSPEDCLKGLGLPATGPSRQVSRIGSELVQKSCVGQAEGSKSSSWLAGCPLSLGHRETRGLARESGLEWPFDSIPGDF